MDITEQEREVFKKMAKLSVQKRFAGKTKEEISKIMSNVRKKKNEI